MPASIRRVYAEGSPTGRQSWIMGYPKRRRTRRNRFALQLIVKKATSPRPPHAHLGDRTSTILMGSSHWVAYRQYSASMTVPFAKSARGGSMALPGLGRRDELGEMAETVEMFKLKARAKAQAELDAKVEEGRAAGEQRNADIARLAGQFEKFGQSHRHCRVRIITGRARAALPTRLITASTLP